jgi:type II restriction/modification system DNA methylase subunit YeeA
LWNQHPEPIGSRRATPLRPFSTSAGTSAELAEPKYLDILHAVFFDPGRLRPTETRAAVTKEAADKFSTIALRLQDRGRPEEVAHFVNQLVFCFFANSVKLLPENFFPRLLKRAAEQPKNAQGFFDQLFAAMEHGGDFGLEKIAFFNGGLFDGRRALPLQSGDIGLLQAAASLDWSQIDPTIFGTLFERFLDPDKRAQIGAHYTDPEKIMMIVEPVILRPLRNEWAQIKAQIEPLAKKAAGIVPRTRSPGDIHDADNAARRMLAPAIALRDKFLDRLASIRILDPACGSGNFLYLALQGVKDLENRVVLECEAMRLPPRGLHVGPEIVHGIEINPLAAELARTTIWIGDIQWGLRNGIYARPNPILRQLDAIECRDALTARSSPPAKGEGELHYVEAEWPDAEFVVGNPPFLGSRLMRAGLGDETVEWLFLIYDGRVSREADLVCYWFEKARAALKVGRAKRVGLVATNSIRGGANRRVLERIVAESGIFEAWSDEPWVVEGAAVRVSLICFGEESGTACLDGIPISEIYPDLASGAINLTQTRRLIENLGCGFQGPVKVGAFNIPGELARVWLKEPLNPNGKANRTVLFPWMNGSDIVRRPSGKWIIDFDELSEREASHFERPFEYVIENIKPIRLTNRDRQRREYWWRLGRSGSDLKAATVSLSRFIVTPRVAKHRVFVWVRTPLLPDSAVVAIARDDDTTFGILHSRFHEAWALRLGTSLEDRPRYTPTTTFETFPFPEDLTPNIPAMDYADDPRAIAISKAAKRLDDLRNAWLNPPDLVRVEPEVISGYPDRVLPKDAAAAQALHQRTLTNLYNQRPQWLHDAHRDLDAAVAAAYGWSVAISEEEALMRLLELNLARSAEAGPMPAAVEDEEGEEAAH